MNVSADPRFLDLLAELDRREAQARQHDPEGVHRARVTCRRLRALLATYRPVLDRAAADALAAELRWFGQELSLARDGHVVHQILTRMLAEEPPGLVATAARARVERTYGGTRAVPDVFGSERYAALRAALAGLAVTRPEEPVLRRRVRKEVDRVVRRHDAVAAAADRDVAMHLVRKGAKRLRYAAELWEPDGGKDARRVVEGAKSLTQLLGERQDTVLVRTHLLDLAAAAEAAGETTFTYGRLHARAQQRAEELDAAFDRVWESFTGPATRSTC